MKVTLFSNRCEVGGGVDTQYRTLVVVVCDGVVSMPGDRTKTYDVIKRNGSVQLAANGRLYDLTDVSQAKLNTALSAKRLDSAASPF
jgi:hypothetical protein